MLAVIREAECIGCTKCIQACPVDAILGAAKQMHTVIANECTGCELCIAPCPVDCIDMISGENKSDPDLTLRRTQAKQKRLHNTENSSEKIIADRKAYIQAAISRVKSRKLS